jgi:hypothetical protein
VANLEKIAHVLDLAAEYVESVEREKQASVDSARQTRLDKIAAAHVAAHGEEMPESARQKLAKTDVGTLDLVEELLQKQAGNVDSLGGPANDDPTTTTKQASKTDADERFLNWIAS